jgi:hypothetical protein
MTNAEDDPELHVDIIRIVARQKEVTTAIQPALDAMQEGMAALRTVCSLIANEEIISDSRLRRSALATFDSAERWLQGHHRFKVDMQGAEKTLMGVKS